MMDDARASRPRSGEAAGGRRCGTFLGQRVLRALERDDVRRVPRDPEERFRVPRDPEDRFRSPRSPWPLFTVRFALRRRSCASERPASSDSLKRPRLSRRTKRLSPRGLIVVRRLDARRPRVLPFLLLRLRVVAMCRYLPRRRVARARPRFNVCASLRVAYGGALRHRANTVALTENMVKKFAARTPEAYARRVRWLAAVYFALNAASLAIVVLVVWRAKHLVALAQRSNVETLTLLIVLALSANYLLTTWRGFVGAIRIVLLNAAYLGGGDWLEIEKRKHAALPTSDEPKVVYLDQVIAPEEDPSKDISWDFQDDAGRLGKVSIRGVEVRYDPEKDGLNNTFFEFLVSRIEARLRARDPNLNVQIVFWRTIDEDAASAYHSEVQAFRNLEAQLGKGPLWPLRTITAEDRAAIERDLRTIAPAVRNESLLPDVEYEAEYSVPVLPEPLAFFQLRRTDNRADPVVTMGCASLIMVAVLAAIALMIVFPPWVPSR
jgi:hypothetical protein